MKSVVGPFTDKLIMEGEDIRALSQMKSFVDLLTEHFTLVRTEWMIHDCTLQDSLYLLLSLCVFAMRGEDEKGHQ